MKLNKLIFTALAGFSLALASCQETEDTEQHYDNKLFISASSFTENILFLPGDANKTTNIKVAIAKPEDKEIKVTMSPAPELLSTYKQAYYNDEVVILPKENYTMPETSTTINAGSISSPSLPIEFLNLGELDLNTVYVLPVTIKAVEGIDVLQSAKTYYYVFRGASLINVVCNISRNRAYPNFKNDSKFNGLAQNTMEMLFKATSFPNTLNTLMGIEGHYLLRLGDAGVPSNQLQVATSGGNLTNSDLQFEAGKWYHIAVTFDGGSIKVYVNGTEKLSGTVGRTSISLGATHTNEDDGSRCFWIGYSYSSDRFFDGAVSEVRIWNRVLTAEEIQSTNHFYTVSGDAEGLISYWKFDEGAGTTVKDYSASGYDLTIEKDPKWESASLPEK